MVILESGEKMKQAFMPRLLPPKLSSEDIIDLLHLEAEAIAKISRCNIMMERSVVREHVMSLFALNESVQSTKIEGTQATISDVYESEATGVENTDIIEVKNYMEALRKGEALLSTLPISTRMFHELHKLLLNNARGQNRSPGEFRKTQNYIGPTDKIEDATYIPPSASEIDTLMSNLERYINDEITDSMGVLSKAAIIHAQFETIHPYLDGNGRLGRILIVLYLLSKGTIQSTNFFLSRELEKNKYQYYALLNGIRNEEPKWKNWITFFIQSASRQADYYIDKLLRIEHVASKLMHEADKLGVRDAVIYAICKRPIFTINYIKEMCGMSYETARKHVQKLADAGFIYPDDRKRNKTYRYYELLDVLRD